MIIAVCSTASWLQSRILLLFDLNRAIFFFSFAQTNIWNLCLWWLWFVSNVWSDIALYVYDAAVLCMSVLEWGREGRREVFFQSYYQVRSVDLIILRIWKSQSLNFLKCLSSRDSWSQPRLTLGDKRGTHWTGRQPIDNHIYIYTSVYICTRPCWWRHYVFIRCFYVRKKMGSLNGRERAVWTVYSPQKTWGNSRLKTSRLLISY